MNNKTSNKLTRKVLGKYFPYVKEVQESTVAFIIIVFFFWLCRKAAEFFFPPRPGDLLADVLHVIDMVSATFASLGWGVWATLGIAIVWLCINIKAVRDKYDHHCKDICDSEE